MVVLYKASNIQRLPAHRATNSTSQWSSSKILKTTVTGPETTVVNPTFSRNTIFVSFTLYKKCFTHYYKWLDMTPSPTGTRAHWITFQSRLLRRFHQFWFHFTHWSDFFVSFFFLNKHVWFTLLDLPHTLRYFTKRSVRPSGGITTWSHIWICSDPECLWIVGELRDYLIIPKWIYLCYHLSSWLQQRSTEVMSIARCSHCTLPAAVLTGALFMTMPFQRGGGKRGDRGEVSGECRVKWMLTWAQTCRHWHPGARICLLG